MLLTLALNVWILYRGVSGGIESLAKIAMPLLFLFAIALITFRLMTGQSIRSILKERPNLFVYSFGTAFLLLIMVLAVLWLRHS